MKRNWNWSLWAGFLFVLVGLFSYTFFAQFPVTRDFPWANVLLFGVGGILLVAGLVRAFGKPQLYRGKIFGPIFALVSLLAFGLFAYGAFYLVRQVPASTSAPRVGEKAPEFALPDQDGKQVALADLISPKGAILIFYRGHW
jgi:AhpC/TSA family